MTTYYLPLFIVGSIHTLYTVNSVPGTYSVGVAVLLTIFYVINKGIFANLLGVL
jgi:hypothetical protein